MVVTNAWGMRNAAPSSLLSQQLRTPCFDFSAKKETNHLSFIRNNNNHRTSSSSNNLLCCRCSTSSTSSSDWDWNRWTRYFSEIEQAESFSSVLKFQLEDAIEKEDFEDAAKLKIVIAETTSKDTVYEIMCHLKTAINEERYLDASRLSKLTGSGLVGWWVGCVKDSDDPFGKIVRITPGVGRFVARSYTPRQLVTASSGTPLFEIFVVRDADQTFTLQVVFLQRAEAISTDSTNPPSKSMDGMLSESNKSSMGDTPGSEEKKAEIYAETNVNIKDTSNPVDPNEEGIKSVINFLKDKIPGLKVKVMNANAPDEIIDEGDSVDQFVQEEDEKTSSTKNSKNEEDQGEGVQNTMDEGKSTASKFFIGGVLHNREENTLAKDDYLRIPAEIKDMEKDSFVLHVPRRHKETAVGEAKVSKVKVAAIAAQGLSELMPDDIAKAFWGMDKVSPKVSRDVQEIVKFAVSKRTGLMGTSTFSRITTSKEDLDPYDGLYVGAFGPFGTEVVQLRRKFGHWHNLDEKDKCADVEFFEYVEAVKLTGDLNVPAGQVTFRAKIGKGTRNSNRGKYPDDLGVVASYKGHGRIAEIGHRNPRWVDGELLQLSGKGMWPYIGGADLGFLYVVPEKSFLVLLKRLKLPE